MAATRKAEGQAVQYCMVCGACCLAMGVKANVPQGVKLCGQVLQWSASNEEGCRILQPSEQPEAVTLMKPSHSWSCDVCYGSVLQC